MTRRQPMRRRRWSAARIVLGLVVLLALVGPWLAPHDPGQIVGPPYETPGTPGAGLLGTDDLGRDVLSRVLGGGREVILAAGAATAIAESLGVALGLAAALQHRRRWVEGVLIRPLDAVVAIPPLILLLLVISDAPGWAAIVLAAVVSGVPLTARVVRAAAAPHIGAAYLEAAIARGERLAWLLGRELLPLIAGPLVADAGVRFVGGVYLTTAAGFLGIGGGSADWGSLIARALPGAQLQPWALLAPTFLVALLAVSANVTADQVMRGSRSLLA